MGSLWDQEAAKLSDADQRMFLCNSTDRPKILRDILAKVDQKIDECQRGRWKFQGAHGKEIIIRDVCERIAAYIRRFCAIMDTAVQADPIHAGLPWAGVRLVLELSMSSFTAFSAVVEGLEKATTVITRCTILEMHYFPAQSDAQIELKKSLQQLYAAVLGFLCEARKYSKWNRVERVLGNPLQAKALQERMQTMEERNLVVQMQKGLVDGERISTTTVGIAGIQTSHSTLQAQLNQLEQPIVRGMDQVSHLYKWMQALSSLLPQSGQWLLNDPRYMAWRDSSSSEDLWLHGIPGCGKTKLTNEEPERSDVSQILRSLVRQLSLTADGHVRSATADEYEKRRREAKLRGESAAELTVEESIELICELGSTSPTTIVIDALDECIPNKCHILLSALANISAKSRDVVKVWVSSRDFEEIRAHFRTATDVLVTSNATSEDLEKFVRTRAADLKERWMRVPQGSGDLDKLEMDLVETLTGRAHGM
ncbi:hypothetical protein SLS55_007213 [Diplodia seriata]|uniref:NWD NACHT-NTPase N-terminal domain-containing protein n=1 Tax=Diplodia seriata TaxID=420778 RepID=A0ABR3CBM0_9PEZI